MKYFIILFISVSAIISVSSWTNYGLTRNLLRSPRRFFYVLEKRILKCPRDSVECQIQMPNGTNFEVKCRKENILDAERTPLNKVANFRIACPLDCRPHVGNFSIYFKV